MSTFVLVPGDKKVVNLLDLAKTTDGPVTAVVVGDDALAADMAAAGFDAVLHVGPTSDEAPIEAFAGAIADLVAAQAPKFVIVPGTEVGRVLAGAVAAKLGSAALNGVQSISADSVEHALYGGLVNHTVKPGATTVVISAGGSEAKAAGGSAPITKADAAPAAGLKVVSRRESEAATVDLAAADRVVCVGRAIAAKEDLQMVYDFAKSVGAEVGCTRPLAEGVDWMPKETYVGVSGVVISPALYFGLGLSGQIQHTAGVKAKTIVAVNKDASAPIFSDCDFGLVGDIYQLVPALTDAFNAAK